MKAPSIFCREFKRTFNANKYMNYMQRVPESHLHLPFYSKQDLLMGRFAFTLAFVASALTMYHDPSYFHETLGHLKGVPQYDNIDNVLQGEEKRLNQLIIQREQAEQKLDHFMHDIKAFDAL